MFVSASNTMKLEWKQGATKKGINVDKAGAKVIVDDILAYATTIPTLTTLQHYSATVKLKKCKWFHSRLCFVGVDVCLEGNLSTKDKCATLGPSNHPTHLLTSACSFGCLDSTPSGFQITRSALNTRNGSSNNSQLMDQQHQPWKESSSPTCGNQLTSHSWNN
jgi:hypothetical protein